MVNWRRPHGFFCALALAACLCLESAAWADGDAGEVDRPGPPLPPAKPSVQAPARSGAVKKVTNAGPQSLPPAGKEAERAPRPGGMAKDTPGAAENPEPGPSQLTGEGLAVTPESMAKEAEAGSPSYEISYPGPSPATVIETDGVSVQRKISPETKALLDKIPADGLPPVKSMVRPRYDISVDRAEESNPFPEAAETPDPVIGPEIGLDIQVKQPDTKRTTNLEQARDAVLAGQTEAAAVLYKRVLANEPENKEAMFGLATAYHSSGQLDQARALYIQLIMADQKYLPALNNFLMLAGQEAPEDALEHLLQLQRHNPEFPPVPAQIGMIYLGQEKPAEAVQHLSRAAGLDPDNVSYRYNLAVALDRAGNQGEAIQIYTQVLRAGDVGVELPVPGQRIYDRIEALRAVELESSGRYKER